MQKNCPSCGTETFPGARFCRRCGAPVRDDVAEGTGDVSPQAATVPLGGEVEGRMTDGLSPADEQGSAQTSRVSLAEMERLLRAQQDSGAQRVDTEAARITPPSAFAHPSAATRPDAPASDYDEELTITVPRSPRTHEAGDFDSTNDFETTRPSDFETTRRTDFETTRAADFDATRPSTLMPSQSSHVSRDNAHAFVGDASTAASSTTGRPEAHAGVARERGAGRRRTWPVVVAVCGAVLLFAVGGAWLVLRMMRRPAVTDLPTQAPTAPVVTSDARQQFDQKLAEAEALLAGGDMEAAVARLREANALDPTNMRGHRRLAELLLSTGARREAIEELRAVTRAEPEDFNAWRQLASAQFAEGLHRDAAESYRRLVALVGEQATDPSDLLSYADALRLSGRAEESRAIYERLASTAPTEIASVARQRLLELARAAPQPTPSPTQHTGDQVAEQSPRESQAASSTSSVLPSTQPTPAQPTPTPARPTPKPPAEASPAEHYARGSGLWSSNRAAALEEFRAAAAGGDYDAHYYLGLSYVEGKNPHALKRAEVVAALQHFQLAQRGRQYVAESRRYEQQLEKEFDRLRKQ
jgi:tetratricopeptide (TPR) repeat protein